ncbi:ABC transporter substrate-binding protein [Clostridium thermarum]|uniref:ABC transporter substrate-binding protein n=1 Tax=Clostridium thermarum TaxID=1716543 RepID=UPI0013D03F14|nr:sugar ABC transporter substrate-binding protein [Clostridium thermarum]
MLRGKLKRFAAISIGLVLALSAITGCSSGKSNTDTKTDTNTNVPAGDNEKSDEPITLSFMGWGNPEEQKVFENLVKQFEEKHKNIKVDYVNVPPADFMVKLQAMVAANKAPDVFYMPGDNFYAWADSGKLANLTPFLSESTTFNPDNVWPEALNRYRYNSATKMVGEGDLYALPKDVGPWAMVYNKNIFKEAGLPEPDPSKPLDWNEIIELAKKLTKGSGPEKQYGISNVPLESAVWANGADFLDPTKTKVTVDDPKFAEAMQFCADLALVHGVAPSEQENQSVGTYQRWLNGDLAMFWMGPWDQPAFWKLPFEWDLMPAPASPSTGKNATWLGSLGFGVSATSKHQKEAFELAAFFSFDPDGQRSNYLMGQAVPNLIDMAKGEYMNYDKAPKNKAIFLDIIENTGKANGSWGTYDGEWNTIFWDNAAKVWQGKQSAADFCKEIQPKMQAALDKAIANSKK